MEEILYFVWITDNCLDFLTMVHFNSWFPWVFLLLWILLSFALVCLRFYIFRRRGRRDEETGDGEGTGAFYTSASQSVHFRPESWKPPDYQAEPPSYEEALKHEIPTTDTAPLPSVHNNPRGTSGSATGSASRRGRGPTQRELAAHSLTASGYALGMHLFL